MSRRLVSWINRNVDFAETYQKLFGRDVRYGKCFCPFHENTDTPAAKYYDDSNTIYCFSCGRVYGSYDLLMAYSPDTVKEIAQVNDIGDDVSAFDRPKTIEPIRMPVDGVSGALELAEMIKIKLASV